MAAQMFIEIFGRTKFIVNDCFNLMTFSRKNIVGDPNPIDCYPVKMEGYHRQKINTRQEHGKKRIYSNFDRKKRFNSDISSAASVFP